MSPFGAPNVEKLQAEGDVKGLIKALRYRQDGRIRLAAAEALAKIGAPAVEPLIAALRDRKRVAREPAAYALGMIGDAQAAEPLIVALKGSDSPVRRAAARALGRIGDARAVEPLIAALKEYGVMHEVAIQALGDIRDARAAGPLAAALENREERVRQTATEALVKIGAPAAEALIAALDGFNARQAAAEALAKIGAPVVEPLIAAMTGGGLATTRLTTAPKVLGTIGAPAMEPLIAALKDEDWQIRSGAARALGWTRDVRMVEPLVAALKDESDSVTKFSQIQTELQGLEGHRVMAKYYIRSRIMTSHPIGWQNRIRLHP